MKKLFSIIAVFFLVINCVSFSAFAADEYTSSAESWVLYCPDNGKVIAGKNAEKRMKPASTTKLLTALLTLEEAQKDNKTVTFTEKMAAEGSSMYLGIGEKVKLGDLAVGMMMASGNDAANAAALSLSGSFEKFAEKMNSRAKIIGMKNTNFVTPSGLDDDNHYTTAYDLALLMSEALKNSEFAELVSQKQSTVKFIKPDDKQLTYGNHNRLLSLYKYCIGGKTGYTMAAGRCLVTAAKKDGLTLICVTLNDRNDWKDHAALYEEGFEHYSLYSACEDGFMLELPCVGSEQDYVTAVAEKDFSFVVSPESGNKIKRVVYADSFLYSPITEGEAVGRIEYTLDGKLLGAVRLVSTETAEYKKADKSFFDIIKELFGYE